MGSPGFPDINGFYAMLYGTAGVDFGGLTCMFYGGASGMVWGGNPVYYVTDFLGVYSKFFGPASAFSGIALTAGSDQITGFSSTAGLAVGQLVVNLNSVPKDSVITAVTSTTITISNPASQNDTVLTVYEAPWVPIVVILMYLNLAAASVMISRYGSVQWPVMMSLFIAHYLTMFMRTESGPNSNAAQVAASGLNKGIIISRAAGDVSASSQLATQDYLEWGEWNETTYGALFITLARGTNIGPVYFQ